MEGRQRRHQPPMLLLLANKQTRHIRCWMEGKKNIYNFYHIQTKSHRARNRVIHAIWHVCMCVLNWNWVTRVGHYFILLLFHRYACVFFFSSFEFDCRNPRMYIFIGDYLHMTIIINWRVFVCLSLFSGHTISAWRESGVGFVLPFSGDEFSVRAARSRSMTRA